ncbi:MAG TPA: peroxiredoxin family protein [Methanocella sp.]|uniref:peroxiredoxin family protein n=1 Tax=Methanocella sp. TaxID=2052833 RepID=UPI002B90A6FC|nr:peroxiredoxin family protein [Methanocella sp.]HTY89944.1 peroxiredoxin family protein [Methanocella sp.]
MYKLMLRLDVGSRAEDFTLVDFNGNAVRLGDIKGIVFLTFYRGGFDRDSVRYLKALAENYPGLGDLGVTVVAVTPELPEKVKGTAESLCLPFVVLCDPDLKVSRQYDVYDPVMKWCWPAGFIIGEDGVIQYAFRGVSPPNTPPVPYLMKKFEQMRGSKGDTAGRAAAR